MEALGEPPLSCRGLGPLAHLARAAGPPVTPAATLGWASLSSPPIRVLPAPLAGVSRSRGGMVAVSPPGLAHGVSPQALSHARAGVRVSGCPGVPRRGQEAAGGAAGGGGAFSAHPGSGGAAASGLQLEPGPAASAGGDSGVPSAVGRGDGMSLGIGVHRVPNSPRQPALVQQGRLAPILPCSAPLGAALCPPRSPQGREGHPTRGAPGEVARLVAVPVSVSPPRWHRGPLAVAGGGRGFPRCWRSSASAGTRREPGPLPPPHPAHQNLVKSAFCECSSPRGSS